MNQCEVYFRIDDARRSVEKEIIWLDDDFSEDECSRETYCEARISSSFPHSRALPIEMRTRSNKKQARRPELAIRWFK